MTSLISLSGLSSAPGQFALCTGVPATEVEEGRESQCMGCLDAPRHERWATMTNTMPERQKAAGQALLCCSETVCACESDQAGSISNSTH